MLKAKFVGSNYQKTESLDVKDIAILIRKDIRDAIRTNNLPEGTYSVTIERFSGGRSIDIRVKEFEFPIIDRALYLESKQDNDGRRIDYYTKIFSLTLKRLDSILNSYNFDDSDSMTDYFHVRFYGHATLDSKLENKEIDAINTTLAPEDQLLGHRH